MFEIKKINWDEKEISSSALKEAKKSTRALLWYYSKEKETKSYFDFGNAVELYLISKEEFKEKVVILDESKRPFPDKNYQTVANRDWKAKFYEDNEGKYIIPSKGDDSFETILEFERLAMKHECYDMLLHGEYQKEFRWTDNISGLKRYSRPDIVIKELKTIIDIKTDSDINFEKSANNNDYFIQAYDQCVGAVESGYMDTVEHYYWFVLSKKEPLYVDVYKFDLENILRLEEVYKSTMHRLKRDLKSNLDDIVFQNEPIKPLYVPNYYK